MNPPNKVFVDTSFFIALLNSSDVDHEHAVKLQTQATALGVHKITSEYVLVELGDGLSRLCFRHLASTLIKLVRQDPSFDIVPASTGLLAKAIDLFNRREDKEWGLTES